MAASALRRIRFEPSLTPWLPFRKPALRRTVPSANDEARHEGRRPSLPLQVTSVVKCEASLLRSWTRALAGESSAHVYSPRRRDNDRAARRSSLPARASGKVRRARASGSFGNRQEPAAPRHLLGP